jgi:hypothetical protein
MAGKQNKDDRQIRFLELYLNPKSDTYTNAYQSAKKAGFSEEYSQNITGQMPQWLSESISQNERVLKAEKVFDECLTMETNDDTQKLKIKQDTAKFIAETIGKDKGYTKRGELTGKNGENIKFVVTRKADNPNDH